MGRIVHRFIRDLTQQSAALSVDLGKQGNCLNYKLTREHLRHTIDNLDRFKFLRKIVEDVPTLEGLGLESVNSLIKQEQIMKNNKQEHPGYINLQQNAAARRHLG